jgi:hypothetical protein
VNITHNSPSTKTIQKEEKKTSLKLPDNGNKGSSFTIVEKLQTPLTNNSKKENFEFH